MKKIGILTYWSSKDNYGQLLQCYALQEYLRKKSVDPCLIKYKPNYRLSNLQLLKEVLNFNKIKSFFDGSRKRILEENEINSKFEEEANLESQKCRFDVFRDKYIKSTQKEYYSIDELQNDVPKMDLYICGSDQVWHDDLHFKNVAGWYLQFGEAERVSYAASMGRRIDDKKEITLLKKYLSTFKAISVRENETAEYLKNLGFKEVITTVDPTLLLDKKDYEKFVRKENERKDYLLVYVLNIESSEDIDWEAIKEFASERCLDIRIVISSGYIPARNIFDGYCRELLTIEEWLSAMANAKYVITTSFHGTVFSLIFNRKFLAFPLKGASGANARIESLLRLVGLDNRLVEKFDANTVMENIDWDSVRSKIVEAREQSVSFINDNVL